MPKLEKGPQSLSINTGVRDIQQKGASRFDVTTCTQLHAITPDTRLIVR